MLFNKKYTLQDLDHFLQTKLEVNRQHAYHKCRILIIDDDVNNLTYPFSGQIEILREQYGMSVITKTDLENVSDAEGYDLIICDRHGIGQKVCGNKGDGLKLLSVLMETYPGKNYVLYSSVDVSINRMASFKRKLLPKVWSKDILANNEETGSDTFADVVVREVEYTFNPLARWKEIRAKFVINTMISLSDLSRLEQAYIKSVIKGKTEIYEKASKSLVSTELSGEAMTYLKASKSVIELAVSILSLI